MRSRPHRQIGASGSQRIRLLIQHRIRNDVLVLAAEGKPPGNHLEQHHPQRPDIRAPVRSLAQSLFRRHVGHRSQTRSRLREPRSIGQQGDPEIADFDLPFGTQQNIRAFYIPVDDFVLVSLLQSLGNLSAYGDSLLERERTRLDPLAQAGAVHT